MASGVADRGYPSPAVTQAHHGEPVAVGSGVDTPDLPNVQNIPPNSDLTAETVKKKHHHNHPKQERIEAEATAGATKLLRRKGKKAARSAEETSDAPTAPRSKGTGKKASSPTTKQVNQDESLPPATEEAQKKGKPVQVPLAAQDALGGIKAVAEGVEETTRCKAKQVDFVVVYKEGGHEQLGVAMHSGEVPNFKSTAGSSPFKPTIGICTPEVNKNDVLHTRSIADCVAVAVLADPHPDGSGVFQKRALVHLQGGTHSGNSAEGPNLVDALETHLKLDKAARANCQVIICFGATHHSESLMKDDAAAIALYLGATPGNVTYMKNRDFAVKPNGEYGPIKER